MAVEFTKITFNSRSFGCDTALIPVARHLALVRRASGMARIAEAQRSEKKQQILRHGHESHELKNNNILVIRTTGCEKTLFNMSDGHWASWQPNIIARAVNTTIMRRLTTVCEKHIRSYLFTITCQWHAPCTLLDFDRGQNICSEVTEIVVRIQQSTYHT